MPYLRIDTRSSVPVYIQIMDQIRCLVREERLDPGTPLPPVRQLAKDLEINPNTVARAYDLLEREGLLEAVPRRGTFVATRARKLANRAVAERLEEMVERALAETRRLGVELDDLLAALARRAARESARPPQR